MIRVAWASVFALTVASCGSGEGSSPPVSGPSPTPSPSPSPTPTPTPPTSVTFTHVFGIDEADGRQPNGPLLLASDGFFYGTTRAGGTNFCFIVGLGCGVVFKTSASGSAVVIKDFAFSEGEKPSGPLIQGRDGAIYGVATAGGAHGHGTIFRLSLSGQFTVLHSFGANGDDGRNPVGALVQTADGSIYGATVNGGNTACPQSSGAGCGTIFKLSASGAFTTVYNFGQSSSDGWQPNGSLTVGSDGNLYGTTANGGTNSCSGPNDCGTVFRITSGDVVAQIHSFGATLDQGIAPQGKLLEGSDGFFYGTTASGGRGLCPNRFGCGTVFRMTKSGSVTTIYKFAQENALDGFGPTPFLSFGRDGMLYGLTKSGGTYQGTDAGTAFRMTTSGAKTILFNFGPNPEQPTSPIGGLVQGADNAFYGMTEYNNLFGAVGARAGSGTIFRLGS